MSFRVYINKLDVTRIFYLITAESPRQTCFPDPCGPNSKCLELNGRPTCSCLPEYLGAPPNCRPECVVNTDCPSYEACVGEKCVDPCPGSCGQNADCRVYNHNPVCTCLPGFRGDAYSLCTRIPRKLFFPFLFLCMNCCVGWSLIELH